MTYIYFKNIKFNITYNFHKYYLRDEDKIRLSDLTL